MSDTTITPRKRKELREYALDCKGEMNRNYFICHLEPGTVLNLLDTIEQAESRIDGGCIEELKRATELAEQAEARAEKEEAEVARLTKERDWLAELVFDRPCAYACCPLDKNRPTGPDDDDCDKTHIQCWAEAARRAVAAGEE